MKDSLLPIYRAVAEGHLTQAQALEQIKALRSGVPLAAQGVVLATTEWIAEAATVPGAAKVGRDPDRILLWGVPEGTAARLGRQLAASDVGELAPASSGTVDEMFAEAALQGFDAIKSLLGGIAGGSRNIELMLIAADEPDSAFAAGMEAMLRTAAEENPALSFRCVRVPAAIKAAELAQVVRDECSQSQPETVVRYVQGNGGMQREVMRWRVLEKGGQGEIPSVAPVVFKEDGCYLITGGAGGIGLQFVREIVAQTRRARIVLAGRSIPVGEAASALDTLRSTQHRIDFAPMDVVKAASVDALVAQLHAEGQAINGIIHCAGVTHDDFIIRKTPEEFASVLAPKVAGLANLDRATRDAPLDFLVLCSSFAACWGIVGQVDYAAANAFMDAFAEHRNRLADAGERRGRTLSVNWPLWQDGAMAPDTATRERLERHTGMRALSTPVAMRAMYRGLALAGHRLLVMEGELSVMQALLADAVPAPRPVQATIAAHRAAPASPAAGDRTQEDFKSAALEFLCQQFSQVLKIPLARLRPDAPLEQYGIDSILAMKLVTHLESIFGKLPKTLAFEYQSIAQLSDYFCTTHALRLGEVLNPRAEPAQRTDDESRAERAPVSQGKVPEKRSSSARVVAKPRTEQPKTSEPVLERSPGQRAEAIAIVGLSGRYPAAIDLDEYWENLSQGRDCIREIPAERWRWQDYYRDLAAGEQLAAGEHSSKWGGFIDRADEFDPRFFNITPRDAEQIDPQERLFLQHAWMAVEDAGYTRAAFQERRGGQVGVYAGVMYGEYNRSGSLASIANRVSYVLNLHGPSMTLDTMCSSSLTAIHIACQDLRLGRTDMALAGGVNLSVHPGKYSMLSGGQFISSEGHCASFGEGGDGYIPGEGVGVVVLKRLSDAERDGDAIHAVIRGSALNHGGKTNGYTVPNPQAQAAVIADALKDAGVDARHVSYIEAHGTGTKLGDPIEIAAISKAFREHTQDRQFCLIGSAKSNIGHCESAAGIAGLTKVILQMRYGQIVPSLHSERLNPNTDFDITPFEVNQRLRPWDAPVIDGRKLPLIAGVSSFGAGGGNAHLVVEAYSGSAANAFQGGTAPRVVLLSARTLPQLRQKAEELSAFVGKNVDIDLDSLAFTLQTGREPMEERLGMLVESRSELTEKLAAFLAADNLEDGAVADDLYYAQSRRHRDTIALFGIDQDLRASIDNWFGGGKLSRLLDMWTKGLDLDWLKLYGSSLPARVHLPVYPFARERYWREEPAGVSPGGVPDADAIHSLVHRNASRPGQQRYRSTFGADDPRLSGLGRPGHSAFPMSLQIEAARAALGDALPSLQQGGTWALQDVRFAAPRRTNGPTLVDIAVLPPGQGERTSTAKVAFELCAGDADGYVFSQGFAESCPTAQPPVLDIASITRGASPLFADRRAIAAAVRGLGLEIGTAHSAADALHRTEDGLWLGLVPSDAAQTAFSDCAINPAIFEALTLAAQWLHPASERLHLPAGFAEMRVYPGSSQPRYARIQATGPVRQDGAFCVDVAVCAGDGTVRIQIESLEMRPIGALAEPVVAPVAVQLERIEAVATAQQALAAERMPDREFRVRSEHTSNARTGAAASDFSAGPAVPKPSITLASPKQAAVEPAGSSLDKSPVSLASQRDEPGASQLASVLLRDRGQGIFALRLRPADDRLDAGLVDAFREALAHARELPSIKALIIESDQRVFLLDGAGGLDDRALQDLQRELASFPFPTVAILEGQAVGAGLWLACTCDLVVAVEDQHYGFASPEGTWIAQASHLSWLSARFGEALAPLLATAERLLTGGELRGSGWGATVVSSGEVTSAVDAICGRLSDKSHNALRLLKEHLAAEFETRLSMFAASMPSEAADAVLTGPGQAAPETATATDAAVTLLSGEDDKRVHLRLRADGATPADVLLQQLEHALRGCGNADVVLLSSEYEGFLPDDASQHGDVLRDALAALSRVSAPVVAVLENSALNSGLLLALACDFAVYSEEGRYGAIALADHHEHLGLFDDLLTRRLGASAHEWALTGERHSGLDLLRRQPLLHVCPADQVLDRAQRLADHVRTLPRGTSVPLRLSPVEGDARASSRAMDSAGEPTAQGDIALTSTVVRASVDDTGVVLVRLEDRDARNMFSDALIAGLQEVFEHIRLSSNYKAVVLVGYDTYFSSGGTRDGLKAIQQGKVRFTDHDVFHLPMRCHLPVIAAMQGHGIGAGWTLGLFSDCVIFSQESSYVSPYMDFGFTPGAGASRVLPEKLGFDLARESLFTSREMPGQELARRNPHLTVVPRDRALTDALALASELSRNSRGDLIAWKSAHVSHRLADWKDLFAREVRMHEATLVGQTDALARIEKRFGPAPQAVAQPVGEPVALAADPAAQAVPAETAVLPVIRRLLADELRVDESDIDPRAQFVDVGLDSISSVTWIRNINKQFGLDIDATKVYSYPDLQKFARYIGGQLPAASVAPVASAAPVQQTTSVMPSVREPAEGAAGRMEVLSHGLTTPAPVSPHVDARIVSRTIIDLLAQELRQEPESIDADRGFVELGLDSISGVTWIRAVNKVYGTSIEATKVYTYPTVAKFARFLSETLAQDAAVQAPPLQVHPTATRQSAVAPATPLAPINAQLSGWPVLPSWQTSGAPATAAPAHPATGAHTAEIAVIGMAGRFPMADDLDMFWDNIANGRNCVSEIPASRWDTQSYYVEGKPGLGQSNSKWMGLLEGHDQFDPTFFGLSPVEAEAMDPQQRVFLQTCWHGMENAGYTAERMSGSKCGVFVGCSYGDYNLLSREQQINSLGFTGNATSILAARVSYFLNLVGPCVSLDTACSSSLVAIATACDSLLTGGSDMALAGGVYVMANSDMFLKTAQAGMLSSDGRCYTFDQRANGFVPGEGVGVVMLKRLADAERDGDRVLAVVRGWGVNQDGRTNGITAPNAESQQRLISDVHDRFGIDAAAIGLVEAHGTGTKLGDPIEIDGLKSSFPKPTARKQHCAIGSVKTNIGHCLTAAGVSGFIKLLLALKHQKLPPSINFETPNEHFDLEDSPFYVNTSLQDWAEPPGAVRHAAISSFGFSGTNAHLVLSQYTPAVKSPVALPAPLEGGCLVALSARTAEQLVQKAIDLRRFITNEPGLDLEAIACSLLMQRDAMDERLCFVAHSLQDVLDRLAAYVDRAGATGPLPTRMFAANVKQGRESVRLLSEDPSMAALVIDKCIAERNLAKLGELWVKGLVLDGTRLYGTNKPEVIALPAYPFAKDAYWIVAGESTYADAPSPLDQRSSHLHPLLQEKLAGIGEMGHLQADAEHNAGAEAADRPMLMHLPTYEFARMRCWIPTKDEVRASTGAGTDAATPKSQQGRLQHSMESIAELFAQLEQDTLTAGEVADRVKQLA